MELFIRQISSRYFGSMTVEFKNLSCIRRFLTHSNMQLTNSCINMVANLTIAIHFTVISYKKEKQLILR